MATVAATHASIARAAAVLRGGGVVAYPTDTFYGLAVDPRNADAVRRLFELKQRNDASAIPLIAASLEQAEAAGRFGPSERALAQAFWPGPLTIIVPATAGFAPAVLGGGSTIAVRVPSQQIAIALAHLHGFCITSTSANVSGEPPATTAAIELSGLDLVLDGGQTPGGPPSTIVEVTRDGPRLVRAGAVPWERVLESLQ